MLSTLLPILTAVLAITTVAAAAFAGLKIGTERTLRDSNSDLRARVADLESGRESDRAKIAEAEAKANEALAENRLLTSMVQGRVEWTAISDQLEEHHRQSLDWWGRIDGHLAEIETTLKETG